MDPTLPCKEEQGIILANGEEREQSKWIARRLGVTQRAAHWVRRSRHDCVFTHTHIHTYRRRGGLGHIIHIVHSTTEIQRHNRNHMHIPFSPKLNPVGVGRWWVREGNKDEN